MISQRCRHQGRGSVFNWVFTSSIERCAAARVTLAISSFFCFETTPLLFYHGMRIGMNPNGTCVIAGFQNLLRLFEHMVLGPLRSKTGNKKVGRMGTAKMNQKDLVYVKELLEAGKVVPVIDRRYPLRETASAIRYLEEGHARGKVIIMVEQNNNASQ